MIVYFKIRAKFKPNIKSLGKQLFIFALAYFKHSKLNSCIILHVNLDFFIDYPDIESFYTQ